jgi:hypothetical protein
MLAQEYIQMSHDEAQCDRRARDPIRWRNWKPNPEAAIAQVMTWTPPDMVTRLLIQAATPVSCGATECPVKTAHRMCQTSPMCHFVRPIFLHEFCCCAFGYASNRCRMHSSSASKRALGALSQLRFRAERLGFSRPKTTSP